MKSMRNRAAFLRRQARQFRKSGEMQHDSRLRAQYSALAEACDSIAVSIEKNIPIHQSVREHGNGQT